MSTCLHFRGPFSFSDVLSVCPLRNEPGIYLWTVKQITGPYRIHYLGETGGSFCHRTKEHVLHTLSGYYRIFDIDQMRRGIQHVLWGGLWGKETQENLPRFLAEYETFVPLIKQYLFKQAIFVAPLYSHLRLRRRIEGALAQHLRSSDQASSLLPADIRYVVRTADEPAVAVSVSADANIDGLPNEILA